MSGSDAPDCGVAATGYVCQNEPEHPEDQPEVGMVSAGPSLGVTCPECGRMAAGPDDEIPYGDPPDYRPSEGLFGPRDRDTFREAIETWGLPAQIDMAVEECAEVIVALQHLQRDRTDREDVIEELADLRIMFEQLRWYFGRDFVDPVVIDKMGRLRERLGQRQPPENEAVSTDGGFALGRFPRGDSGT